ncbi:hypothetical protein J2T56_003244 [Natronobacillus azotifigens]
MTEHKKTVKNALDKAMNDHRALKRPPAQAGGFGHECRRLKSLLRLKSS